MRKIFLLLLLTPLAFYSCKNSGGSEPDSDSPEQTDVDKVWPIDARSAFDTTLNEKNVSMEGYLKLPSFMSFSFAEMTTITIVPRPNYPSTGAVEVQFYNGNEKNNMVPLPDKYDFDDLKVIDSKGDTIRRGDRVKVQGKINVFTPTSGSDSGTMQARINVSSIEKIKDTAVLEAGRIPQMMNIVQEKQKYPGKFVYADGFLIAPSFAYATDKMIFHFAQGDEQGVVNILIGNKPNQIERPTTLDDPKQFVMRDHAGNPVRFGKVSDAYTVRIRSLDKVRLFGTWIGPEESDTDNWELYVEKIEILPAGK